METREMEWDRFKIHAQTHTQSGRIKESGNSGL